MTYGSFRSPQYRDYEQPWNKDYFNYGRSTQIQCQRSVQQHQQRVLSKENCHLCRESKRRSLAAYIRGKSRSNSCHEIHEEEEEHDNNAIARNADDDEASVNKCDNKDAANGKNAARN
ncbi:hypothetical protein KM043_018108 [Ampulex compressa]|nr:hypothetical protein KM043_018108 [Ampulex compressa]